MIQDAYKPPKRVALEMLVARALRHVCFLDKSTFRSPYARLFKDKTAALLPPISRLRELQMQRTACHSPIVCNPWLQTQSAKSTSSQEVLMESDCMKPDVKLV